MEQRISNPSLRKERFRYLMNSLMGSPSKAARPKTELAKPRTPGRKRKNASKEDSPSVKKARNSWKTGEVDEEDEQEIPTAGGMRGHATTHSKQEAEQYTGDGEFSFFDHALYQED